jgi:hypothetical protein
MRRAFCIYKVQSDGGLHFVKAKQTFDDAKARVRELGDVWPGEYVIENEETGERYSLAQGTRVRTDWRGRRERG